MSDEILDFGSICSECNEVRCECGPGPCLRCKELESKLQKARVALEFYTGYFGRSENGIAAAEALEELE